MDEPPALIGFLQRVHLILPPDHHQVHHTAPYNTYYCITVGWLNWPLAAVKFFPTAERLITWATGLLPRQDDIGDEAAIALVEADSASEAPVMQVAKELLTAATAAEETASVSTRPSA
jgi:ubiquitin-conjugating enzyme E2 variant